MSFVWTVEDYGYTGMDVQYVTPFLAVIGGLLMVSRVRYFSFKAWPKSDRVPFIWIPAVVLIIVALAINTSLVLFCIACLYVISGPVVTLVGRVRHRGRRASRVAERRET